MALGGRPGNYWTLYCGVMLMNQQQQWPEIHQQSVKTSIILLLFTFRKIRKCFIYCAFGVPSKFNAVNGDLQMIV